MSHRNDERKNQVYSYINEFISRNGISPTTAEICASLSLSKATVSKYVNRLTDEGLLERQGRYGLISQDTHRPRARMKIIGTVACGKPALAEEDIMGYITVDEYILEDGKEYFALVADGDSMIDAGIYEGDIIYVEKTEYAEEGNIVVALIEDEQTGEHKATLKRLYFDKGGEKYILHPENKRYSDIIVDELKILGVGRRVLKHLS